MKFRILAVLAFLVAVAGGTIWYYRSRNVENQPVKNVVLITIDTLRADHLGSYGYPRAATPNMDQWAANGSVFLNAIATTPLTLPSHSSLMTGEYPFTHGVRDNGGFYLEENWTTVAEALQKSGFRTGGFVSAFVLDRRWGIAQGFDHYFDNFELSKFKTISLDSVQRRGDETLGEALAWMEKNKEERFFSWLHLYDPHTPYDPPDAFKSEFQGRGAIGLYDGEIAFVDSLMGRLDEFLEQNNLWENTMVILTADHGEGLGEHEESGHGFFVYDATMRVPLIVRMPNREPRQIRDQVRSIDLYATICEATGTVCSAPGSGTSLVPLIDGKDLSKPLTAYSESYYPRYHYGWSELKALRTNEYKYIQAPRKEWYRLSEDPREKQNLYGQQQSRAAAFESEITKLVASSGDKVRGPSAIDNESLEKLQALGYIGSFSHLDETADSAELADPKDKIRLYNTVKLAQGMSAEGNSEEAMRYIRRVLQEDDRILEAHLVEGNLHFKKSDYALARQSFQNALKHDPNYNAAIFALARAYKEEGEFEAARAGFERLIQSDPRDTKPYVHLSDIALAEKKFDQALQYLQKVIELEPRQAVSHNRLGACYLEMQQFDLALKEIDTALQLNERMPNAHFNKALAYEAQGNLEQAIGEYRAELTLYPEAYPAHFNLSRIYRQLRRPEDERRELEECIRKNPDFGIAYLYLAKNVMDAGADLEKAKQLAEDGLQRTKEKSQIPFAHYLLADIYNRLGRRVDAMQQLKQARISEKGRI